MKRSDVAVCAIFKNELPYILEWVAFHRVVGVAEFYIADNASNDGSSILLAALAAAGIVTHIPFPGVPGVAPQLQAYDYIIRDFRPNADWIAFIDADEFLLPADGGDVSSFLDKIGEDRSVGSVALNWASYGSSGQVAAGEGLVIQRFTKRADKDWPVNRHYKSIVRNNALVSAGVNPHVFVIDKEYRHVHASGEAVLPPHSGGAGLSTKVVWDGLRVNHYVVKSKEEFLYRKRLRGRATTLTQTRDEKFFNSHDRNDIIETMHDDLVSATREEVSRLRELLIAGGFASSSFLDSTQFLRSSAHGIVVPTVVTPRASTAIRGRDFFFEIGNLVVPEKLDIVFDVGANSGQSVREVKSHFPDSKIYSFEPVLASYEKLLAYASTLQNVDCFNVVLSSSSGYVDIECDPEAVNSRIVSGDAEFPVERVEAIVGHEFCKQKSVRKIDFLKIDTEGHDLEVLKGFAPMLAQEAITFVQVECGMNRSNSKHVNILEVFRFFESFDYNIFGLYEQVRELNNGSALRRSNLVMVANRVR